MQRGKNCHYIAYRIQICAFLAFCVNLVAMATPFAPLKFLVTYRVFNYPTQKTLPNMQTLSPYLA